jgi:SSS family solute:Na+ symporter
MQLTTLDLGIIAAYGVALIVIAGLLSLEKPGHAKDSTDYFLAGRALPWWAVGASLIAANISAEQMIGMSGSGFVVGLAIASYEWMSALTLLIVGKITLPILLKHHIMTMPQFLELRFDGRVRTLMAVFWIAVYTFVTLTTVLWLGATAINALTGWSMLACMAGLVAFSLVYSLYGGLKAVAMTDLIQVVMLTAGGLFITWIALHAVSKGAGPVAGFATLMTVAPQKFDLILSADNPEYKNLPGLGVLLGGMWVMNLSYWGFNQFIIQRALAAKDIDEARKGIVLAAFLKLLMPFIIVVPGIAAYVLTLDPATGFSVAKPDQAYPGLMALAPEGLRGLIVAGLIAAIVSSLGSMMNSIATIATLDIFKPATGETDEGRLVWVGRLVSFASVVAALLTAQPLLGRFDQAFQYIQEFTGFATPGVCALFLIGMFWKRATANGAIAAVVGTAVFSVLLRQFAPETPFMDRVGIVFLLCCAAMVVTSLLDKGERARPISLDGVQFKTTAAYNGWAALVVSALIVIYAVWW